MMNVCSETVDAPRKLRILPNRGTLVAMNIEVRTIIVLKLDRVQLNAVEC